MPLVTEVKTPVLLFPVDRDCRCRSKDAERNTLGNCYLGTIPRYWLVGRQVGSK